MQRICTSIDEFSKIRENCVFCHTKLKPTITNFIIGSTIPVIRAKLKNDEWMFVMLCTNESFSITVNVSINSHTNELQFLINAPDTEDYEKAKGVLNDYMPHMKLACPNKKCKMKYSIQSDVFRLDPTPDPSTYKIRPIILYMESFYLDRLWIQNEWLKNRMFIYSQTNINADSIKADLLNLEDMGQDKIVNRIRTLVTFS
jgi:hypothetical protein